jgi:NAD(P)H dehydrogenase (quinone)
LNLTLSSKTKIEREEWIKAINIASNKDSPRKLNPVNTTLGFASGKKLVVVGASGSVGTSTVQSLLKLKGPADEVVAMVRDPSSSKAAPLAAAGATLVAGDMGKPDSLSAGLQGASVAFVVTPGVENRTELALAGLNACVKAGAQHVVVLSVVTGHADYKGQVFADQFIPVEAWAAQCGVPCTVIRLPMFLQNLAGQMESIKGAGQFYSSAKGDCVHNDVDVGDAAEAVARIMLDSSQYAGQTVPLLGKPLSSDEVAATLSKLMGKKVEHVSVPAAGFKESLVSAGWPAWQVDGMNELLANFNLGKPAFTEEPTAIEKVLGRPITPLAQVLAQLGFASA